ATSAITYAVDTLEHQLDLQLFDRGTTRPPKLTQAGHAVVAEARAVTLRADMLRARVKGLVEGLEAEVSLAVDHMVPVDQLAEVLRAFNAEFPTVPIRMKMETVSGVERLVRSGHSAIGIGSFLHMKCDGLTSVQVDGVLIIPVARSD